MTNRSGSVGMCLAVAGMIIAIGGISASEFKPILIGFVLLAGSAVFALLSIAARKGAANLRRQAERSAMQEVEF